MKHFAKKMAFVAAMSALAFQAGAAEKDITYSYAPANASLENIGVQEALTYNVAIWLDGSVFQGATLKTISAYVVNSTVAKDYKVWASTELSDIFVPDVCDMSTTAVSVSGGTGKEVSVDLDTPYTITEKGLYVGYTFTITSATTSTAKYPVIVANTGTVIPHSLYMMMGNADRTECYGSWEDYTSYGWSVPLTVGMSMDLPEYGLFLQQPSVPNVTKGVENTVPLTVYNKGAVNVSSFNYVTKAGENSAEGEVTFDEPLDEFMESASVNALVNVPDEWGNQEFTLQVTKINGVEVNLEAQKFNMRALTKAPKKLPLLEDATSTLCGYCPLAFGAMKEVADKLPEAVLVSYHSSSMGSSDPMIMKAGYPTYPFSAVGGIPAGSLDRTGGFGFGYNMDLASMYKEAMAQPTPVEIVLDPVFTDDTKSAITVNSDVIFRDFPEEGYYRIGFVLTTNGLTGSTTAWQQSNYLGNDSGIKDNPYMEPFYKGGSKVSGLVYDDVAVDYSTGNAGIKNSLPHSEDVLLDAPYYNTYEFVIDECINLANNVIIQDVDNLYVVAYVICGTSSASNTGWVVNSCRAKVKPVGEGSGIANAEVNKEVESVAYYDFAGRRIANPAAGMYVRITHYTDGTHKADKVAIR